MEISVLEVFGLRIRPHLRKSLDSSQKVDRYLPEMEEACIPYPLLCSSYGRRARDFDFP